MVVVNRTIENSRKAYLVGGGIAGLAAAAYLIRDGGLLGANITVYEEGEFVGGCLDAGSIAKQGYSMRGERMFENNYVCMYDLASFIPSVDDPTRRNGPCSGRRCGRATVENACSSDRHRRGTSISHSRRQAPSGRSVAGGRPGAIAGR